MRKFELAFAVALMVPVSIFQTLPASAYAVQEDDMPQVGDIIPDEVMAEALVYELESQGNIHFDGDDF